MIHFFRKALWLFFLCLPFFSSAQETITLMAYNLLNYEGLQPDSAIRNPYFRKIMQEVKPDLLVCEEVVVYSAIQGFVANVMNSGTDLYSLGTFITGFDTNKALIYRKDKFTFLTNKAIHTDLRDINEFTVIFNPSGDTLRLFAVHLKASSGTSDKAQRALEVDTLRKHTNALPPGSSFVVCGDFNIYTTTEAAYQKLFENGAGEDGNLNDPIPITGTFNNAANAPYHTQSTRVRSFGGGVTGGLDDRFDMLLFSNAVMQPGGFTYVLGSTKAFGNDGNHYNDSINRPPNTVVGDEMADALHQASDHLPIIAQLTVETTGGINAPLAVPSAEAFPNPCSNETQFVFSYLPTAAINFQLTDCLGSIIDRKLFPADQTVHYAFPNVPNGIYFYRMEMRGVLIQGKIVKQ